ncbi:MAG TPA: DUF2268 domain-containing putative Zn-dependent protease [Streptosporangiaceae bacterium]|jgi:hypothetical protein
MSWPGAHRYLLRAALPALILMVAACSSGPGPSAHPATTRATPQPVTRSFARNRFTVTFSGLALEKASASGVSLPQAVAPALARISALLPGPGPKIPISVTYGGSHLTPQTGTGGQTNPADGVIVISFGPTPQVSLSTVMKLWLPRVFAHEIDHSVRIATGVGIWPTLLQQIIAEGISSAFDLAAFPGTPNPWDRAISRSQECVLWKKAQPLLGQTGLYDQWFFGGPGLPVWTAFTIGYDIVTDYHHHHPGASWPAITATASDAILAGSHYQPCPP